MLVFKNKCLYSFENSDKYNIYVKSQCFQNSLFLSLIGINKVLNINFFLICVLLVNILISFILSVYQNNFNA